MELILKEWNLIVTHEDEEKRSKNEKEDWKGGNSIVCFLVVLKCSTFPGFLVEWRAVA